MKVALVYDRVNKWGGAERVLLALHKIFPSAPLYTAVYNASSAKWADVFTVNTSFLQSFPYARTHHEIFAPLMPLAFESFSFEKYDVVISVTSESAKGIITPPGVRHICICLTPTRYLWSGYTEYFKNPLFKLISFPVIWYLKKWDKVAAKRPDVLIAISETVQKRIKKYYDKDSVVIYPPVTLKQSIVSQKTSNAQKKDSRYFLVVSRLSKMTAYKRVDIAIKAANRLKLPLVIVGTGRDEAYYKNLAGDTVQFVGNVSDRQLSEYYQGCKALIFPGNEDFGLVMVEAQSHGKPVIAYRKGGAKEIIQEGKTGEFFDRQSVKDLISILKSFDNTRYNGNDCIDNAKRFSFEQFEKRIKKIVNLS